MKEVSIKRRDLVTEDGKLTRLGSIAFIFLSIKCVEIACREFNKFISDDKE